MKKFRVTQDLDYVMGHLRYGHLEGEFEAESKEELFFLLLSCARILSQPAYIEKWSAPKIL